MQAVVFDAVGEPESVLQIRDIDAPRPQPGQVRVQMLASPINPSDLMYVRGGYTLKPELPARPGFEGVGIVVASGGGLLGRFLHGKRVAVLNRRGGNWAEQVVVPARQVIPLSRRVPLDQAATFFVNPATALVMTTHVLRVPPQEWLVQTAAGSELGKMVIRLGRRYGFRTLNVVRRPEQAAELQQLGADRVLVFDPTRSEPQALADEIRVITNGGVRYALDSVGGATGTAVSQALGQHGRMLVFGTLSGEPIQLAPRDLMTPGAGIAGFWLGNYMESLRLPAKLRLVKTLANLIVDGTLSSEIGQKFALHEISAAVRAAQQSGRNGKVLLTMSEAAS